MASNDLSYSTAIVCALAGVPSGFFIFSVHTSFCPGSNLLRNVPHSIVSFFDGSGRVMVAVC